ncbi:F-box only protein 43 [Eucyclogobius newberryi]|uniref:F-box only protein 43 n=1 Tax=Eucyclogobius newberryi TaxID=166745 RepID=UPI003B5AD863
MQCTPEPNVFFNSDKKKVCNDDCFDSGYSGLFYTPHSITRDGSLGESDENLLHSGTPKDRTGCLRKDRAACWPSTVSWCETPKLYKRDASLQYRLAVCKSILDVKANATKSPRKNLLSVSGQCLSTSLDSLETVIGTLSTSTLSFDQDLPLSGRKRRFLYSHVRTSTLEDGQATSEQLSSFHRRVSLSDADFKEACSPSSPSNNASTHTPGTNKSIPVLSRKSLPSPVCNRRNDLSDSSVLYTPSSLQTPKYTRSLCEDSGFSSLTLDKSQDSSVDHDGSFQELLLSASKGNGVTSNLQDTIRRPWLQRQNRLSTLKEGGSQSEDDPTCRSNQGQTALKEDEVFTAATPPKALSLKPRNSVSLDSVASTKQHYTTPLRRISAKGECKTPFRSGSIHSDATPSRNNLSMTPALQLVHAMCQQKAQTFNGQSPSLKDELISAAALVQTPVTFSTTMSLAGLIGRKMGVGTVDILTELNKRNLKHILSLILGHLMPKCIYRCGRVCKSWKAIIQQDRRASFKRRSHLGELNSSLEQGPVALQVPEADTRTALLKRSALKTVQSQSRSQSCTPQSGSRSVTPLQNSTSTSASSSKQDKFIEVAKTLFNDECLKPCPRCESPARCHSVKGEGVCSKVDCGFQFCISCLCAFHGSRECGSQSVNRRKKDLLIPGSAQSKRNIRRL